MPLPLDSEPSRRRLLAAGNSVFGEGIDDLKGVPGELETILRLFGEMGYGAEPPALDLDHTTGSSSEPVSLPRRQSTPSRRWLPVHCFTACG